MVHRAERFSFLQSPGGKSSRRSPLRFGRILLFTLLGIGLIGFFLLWFVMIRMPSTSFRGPLPPLSPEEETSRARVQSHIQALAGEIGERNLLSPARLDAAADYIESAFRQIGYEAVPQKYLHNGQWFRNLAVTVPGESRAEEIILLGAHYDTVMNSPGADDNATGVATVLELARLLKAERFGRTIRFLAFTNEEGPSFLTGQMGSRVYAREARRRGEKIVAMISIESIGYYSSEKGSQRYPFPLNLFYPGRGDFIAFVGNIRHRELVRQSIAAFRRRTPFPSEGVAAPSSIPGVAWSDHDSFWREGYAAMMVTDTVPFRNPHYHRPTDRPETVDSIRVARVVHGLADVVRSLAQGD
ncbi:MAG: M20/M25/M40 family metallo-hydrolase [Candidatus Manganitrophus sp.]|nr:M20/M25/M40 family metallo-hydrolase [Candidatus Manganitrophus sp.]